MNIVLDTSALIYWTLDPNKLTDPAQTAIDNATGMIVSAMSIWEIGLKVKRKRLEIPLSIHAYVNKLNDLSRLDIQAVSVETWLENLALDWDHRDPADRTIVATAVLAGCPLVSSDREMKRFYKNTIW